MPQIARGVILLVGPEAKQQLDFPKIDRLQCADQRATHGARQTGLTRKQGNSGHRWLYRRARARLGFAVESINKVAAEMQKRRVERDAFGGSVRRNRIVYFT